MKKRKIPWKYTMKVITPLTITCGIIAATYFFYRAALITVPAVAFEQSLFNTSKPLDKSLMCPTEDEMHLKDPAPILSGKYQQRIKSQKSTLNLVINPSLSKVDPVSEEPVGYNHNTDKNTATFEYLQDSNDKQLFLRAVNQRDSGGDDAPTWLPDFVPTKADHSYAYGFSYRSSVPVRITVEYIKNDKSVYQNVMTLKQTESWQDFTAHFDNTTGASAFRILLTGQGEGYVDSRNFDIHGISDAELSHGLVSVTFDDGWQSVNDGALQLLDKYHIRTTQFVISEYADRNVAGYMNMKTVAQLKKSGHEIGSHSLLHCDQANLSDDLVKDNAVRSKETLEKNNLGPIKSFAYPLGQYDEASQAVVSKYYPLIRTSDFGYNDRYFDETNIHSIGVTDKTSDSEFRSWLEHARAHHLWMVIVYHRVNESGHYNVTTAQLESQLKMIQGSGLKVLPLSEAALEARK